MPTRAPCIDAVSLAVTASGAELLSLVIGGSVVAAMLIARRVAPRIPIALLAMIVALIASVAFDLQALGVTVLGPVAAGLPSISVPYASPAELVGLIPGALGLAVLSFADTTVTGRSFAARHGERTDANRELVALAAADAAGGVTGGYPVSSSPSRTSAGEAAGSTSQMTGVIAAAAVAVVLVLLTGPLAFLPIPALGGVIFVAVLGLIDVVGIRSIWALKRSEGLIALTAAGGVILYGTLTGVVIAVLLAALNIVRRSAWPEIVEEGRLPDGTWRDPERSDAAVQVEGVLVLRFAGPLFFANVGALEARIREAVASAAGYPRRDPRPRGDRGHRPDRRSGASGGGGVAGARRTATRRRGADRPSAGRAASVRAGTADGTEWRHPRIGGRGDRRGRA